MSILVLSALFAGSAARANAATDVMFLFDTTGSMGGAITESNKEMQIVMSQISSSLPDVQFGLSELKDYSAVNYNGQPEAGSYDLESGNLPWTLVAPISPNQAAVNEGLLKLEASGGGDSPEAYGRALYETDTNPAVGWRPGVRSVIVLVADDVPHDDDLNVGIPPELFAQESPFNTGQDPGVDNTLATADDLDWQSVVLQRLALDGKPLEYVHYQGTPAYFPYWQNWAARTGGTALTTDDDTNLIADIIAAIKAGASAALPACPPGQIRDASEHCVVPPSNKFEFVQRISCSKGCRIVLVKLTFDSAGNVIAESIPEEEAKGSVATTSATAKCGKKATKAACKKPPLIKKLQQTVVAGSNTLKLKLTGAALKKLKKKGKLKLKVNFTFTPTGGFAASKSHTYKVKLPKKKKGGARK